MPEKMRGEIPQTEGAEPSMEELNGKERRIENAVIEAGLYKIGGTWATSEVFGQAETGKITALNFSGPDGAPSYPVSRDYRCDIGLCLRGRHSRAGTGLTYKDGTQKFEPTSLWDTLTVGKLAEKGMTMDQFQEIVGGVLRNVSQ